MMAMAVALFASCGGGVEPECEHIYADGVCEACGEADPNYTAECAHVFSNGGCTKCNKACICIFENGACRVCGKACSCNFVDGACTVCARACECDFEDGVCPVCGLNDPYYIPVCEHEFLDGACTKCGESCECVFANGACVFCKKACECSFVDGACVTCGKACECTFRNGECTVCGKACKCTFVNGACAICGKACNCNFENGACTVCLKACECSFDNGACTVCGKACECEYKLGACTVCGAIDPEFDGKELYDEMIEKFKYLLSYKKANYELPEKEENPTVPNYDALYEVAGYYEPTNDLGYSYRDINGDGIVELLLVDPDARIYALFTLVDKEPVTVETFQNGLGYIYNNEMIFYTLKTLDESGIQISSETHFAKLVGDKLIGFAYGREDHDRDYDAATKDIFYIISEEGARTELAEDEYKLYSNYLYEYFTGYATRLSQQSNLFFYSATGAMSEATVAADFSSYDAIIKTFGFMYTDVAGGKYVRSSYTSGKYREGMIFNTEDDFVIYNKLLAACVLTQNSSSATFGYAKRDLNGDGVEELVLLEGTKYYVLAVFTEVDGKPVLLDTFNDIRVAFIDGDGFIHVYERVLPGSKKDTQYYVYAVDGGRLTEKEAFGVKYDTEGKTQVAWYKIVDGERVDIEKTEFEALLEEYFLVVGTVNAANCAKYTKNNSKLEFILAYTTEE